MYSPPHHNTRSPPPLQHPIPTHPPRHVPEPPVTPSPQVAGASGTSDTHMSGGSARSRAAGGSGGGSAQSNTASYVRYSSPPIQPDQPAYGQSFGSAMNNSSSYSNSPQQQQQHQQGGNFYSTSNQQQQQGSFGGNFPNFLQNDPNINMTAQMGMHFGQQMASVGGEYVQKNVSLEKGQIVSQPPNKPSLRFPSSSEDTSPLSQHSNPSSMYPTPTSSIKCVSSSSHGAIVLGPEHTGHQVQVV